MASFSSFVMFGFGGFNFSRACLTFHLSLSPRALGIFMASSSISAIKSKLEIRLTGVAKLRLLFSSDSSGWLVVFVVESHRPNQEHNQRWFTNFNERTNTLLYKNMHLSHFLLERVNVSVVCERWVETGTDRYIDPNSSVYHSSTSSVSWLGLLKGGHSPQSAGWSPLWPSCPQLTQLPPVPVYILSYRPLTSASSSVYLHRCISWLTTRSRVNIQHFVLRRINPFRIS